MAIKLKQRRDTYRSNVKKRPLRQNGLEAQYQGIDIKEINIDHSGLPILGRGGFGSRRDYIKVQKEYIVDVGDELYKPDAVLTFAPDWSNYDGTTNSLQNQFHNAEFTLVSPDNTSRTYKIEGTSTTFSTGQLDGSDVIVNINHISVYDNSLESLFFEIRKAIESDNGHRKGIFNFINGPVQNDSGAYAVIPTSLYTVAPNSIKFITYFDYSNITNPTNLSKNHADLTVAENFSDHKDTFVWALNGHKQLASDPLRHYVNSSGEHAFTTNPFYEDIRSDSLLSNPYSGIGLSSIQRKEQVTNNGILSDGSSFLAGDVIVNADQHMINQQGTGSSIDPIAKNLTDTQLSDEVLVKAIPKRDPILNTSRYDDIWSEDIYWHDVNERTWTNLQNRWSEYHSSFLEHLETMIDGVYYPIEDIPQHPLSERIDPAETVSRIHLLPSFLPHERHSFSMINQYLEPTVDFVNVINASYPIYDMNSQALPWSDMLGKRFEEGWSTQLDEENPIMFHNFFDTWPIEKHNFKELDYYSRIDEQCQQVMSDKEWDNEKTSELKIIINSSFGTETGSLFFRNAIDGINKKWFEIIFSSSISMGDSVGFDITGTMTGDEKSRAYQATIGTHGAGQGTIITMLQRVLEDAGSTGTHTQMSNIAGFNGWNSASTDWIVSAQQSSGQPFWIKLIADNDSEGWDFDSVSHNLDSLITVVATNSKYPTNRSFTVDRRIYQDPQHVITTTGFINSQNTYHEGIVYRETMR